MPATQHETVGLDLVGDFKSKAEEGARAALAEAAALEKLGVAASGVKGPSDAAHDSIKAITVEAMAAKDAAAAFRKEADRAFALGNKRRGEALERAAEKIDPIFSEEQQKGGSLWGEVVVGAARQAGAILLNSGVAAAKAIASGAFDLLKAGVAYGVESSAASQKQIAILDRLTGGFGAEAKDFSEELAGATGIDDDTALEQVKGLIQAGFEKQEVEDLFRAAADIGAVKGEEKGRGFINTMETIAAKGKITERSLLTLAEAGVKSDDILGNLAKKGESLDSVRARIKAGTVSMTDFTSAVRKAVDEDIGGVAGKGIDAEINKLKIEFGNIFEDFDLSPVKDALKAISDTMASPAGSALKDSIKEAVQATIDLLKPLASESGRNKLYEIFSDAAEVIRTVTDVVRTLKGEFQTLADEGLSALNPFHVFAEKWRRDHRESTPEERIVEEQVAAAQAKRAGNDIAKGYAEGIRDGAPEIADAVKSSLQGGIEAGNTTLDRHSPSKVFHDMGKDSALGYAKGANDNAGMVADAGAAIGRGAIGGASSSASSVSLQVNLGGVHVQASPGMSAAMAEQQADMIMEALTPKVAAIVRLLQRDAVEFSGSLTTRVA